MRILALDPGPEQTAYVFYDGKTPGVFGICANFIMQEIISTSKTLNSSPVDQLVIEGIACYGMPVGKETFETCYWIGRFWQSFGSAELVYRRDVKIHLCGSMKAKDPMIRQALLDRFGPGKDKAIGTKKNPGPLYGFKSHCWSALAVAVTYCETRKITNAH